VRLEFRVPEDAELWINGSNTKLKGALRQFVSPPLEPAQDYTYEVRARWLENGREVIRTRQLKVRAGEYQYLDLSQQSPDEASQTP
jgi:uncharacterized protein (TIGR03000 family)